MTCRPVGEAPLQHIGMRQQSTTIQTVLADGMPNVVTYKTELCLVIVRHNTAQRRFPVVLYVLHPNLVPDLVS
jgi:hypothetical protein